MATSGRATQWTIRPATPADAYDLADIRNASRTATDEPSSVQAPMREELDFLDRLSLPHGDDYFCIVAEERARIAGYLIGGGSRDLDRKAHGEVYEIAVLPASRRRGVGRALLGDALERFDAAAFAGTLLSASIADRGLARLATGLGMVQESFLDRGDTVVRYERTLQPSSDRDRRS